MEPRTESLQFRRRGTAQRSRPGREALDRLRQEGQPTTGAVRTARALGWLSVGLGVAELITPDGIARFSIGRDGSGRTSVVRAPGLGELLSGIGLLARKRPTGWLWARVAGDVMDLALLRSSLRRGNKREVWRSMGVVAGVTLLDTVASIQLSRASAAERRQVRQVTSSVTINRPPEEVYRFWHDLQNLPRFMANLETVRPRDDRRSHWIARGPAGGKIEWDAELVEDRPNELISWRTLPGADIAHAGVVRFTRAPGGRGTELSVEMDYLPPGGLFGMRLAKLVGRDPRQQLENDLRRLKQVLETGEVLHSDASIHRGMHPARPSRGDGSRRAGGLR
jgi:uncharacterized membrane protein